MTPGQLFKAICFSLADEGVGKKRGFLMNVFIVLLSLVSQSVERVGERHAVENNCIYSLLVVIYLIFSDERESVLVGYIFFPLLPLPLSSVGVLRECVN